MLHAHEVHVGESSYTTIRCAARTLFTTASASRRVQAIKCGFPGSCSSRDHDRAAGNTREKCRAKLYDIYENKLFYTRQLSPEWNSVKKMYTQVLIVPIVLFIYCFFVIEIFL